jgi:hypothetical protein
VSTSRSGLFSMCGANLEFMSPVMIKLSMVRGPVFAWPAQHPSCICFLVSSSALHYYATSSHTHFAHRYGADAFAFRGGFFQIEGRPVTLDENLLTTVTGTAAKGDNTIKVGELRWWCGVVTHCVDLSRCLTHTSGQHQLQPAWDATTHVAEAYRSKR